MSELVFLAHIPLLRIDSESLPFAGGDLWRMPFGYFLNLTGAAFEDHQSAYEETSPVFYRVVMDLDLPNLTPGQVPDNSVAIQLKTPSNNWGLFSEYGMGYLEAFHDRLVDHAWAALLLASPSSALPPPRLSVTFVISVGDAAFTSGEQRSNRVQIQGDADQEYLFFPDAAGTPLPAEIISEASSLLQLVDRIQKVPVLSTALASLLGSTSPTLRPAEQLTISAIALEALLLPELRSGLGKTFATRVASLLASNKEHLSGLKRGAAALYDQRSSVIHGKLLNQSKAAEAIENAYGQQFLGAAIREMAERLSIAGSLEKVRSSLNHSPEKYRTSGDSLPQDSPPGLRQFERLQLSGYSRSFAVLPGEESMNAPEGTMLSWAPLIGLAADESLSLGGTGAPVVLPLTGRELLGLEDKDIRRDFAAQLLALSHPISVLATAMVEPEEGDLGTMIAQVLRERDIGVAVLRLSGFSRFHDPELLGPFIYDGIVRMRRPTVFRQTLLTMVRTEPEERIASLDASRIAPLWQLLANYEATCRHAEIDQVLIMFRRSFDRRFLSEATRATLLLSALEAMLGRFRQKLDVVQLEDLVVKLVGSDSPAGRWFAKKGRHFRNAFAHNYSKPGPTTEQSLDHISTLVQAALIAYIKTWVELSDRKGENPGRALVRSLQET